MNEQTHADTLVEKGSFGPSLQYRVYRCDSRPDFRVELWVRRKLAALDYKDTRAEAVETAEKMISFASNVKEAAWCIVLSDQTELL